MSIPQTERFKHHHRAASCDGSVYHNGSPVYQSIETEEKLHERMEQSPNGCTTPFGQMIWGFPKIGLPGYPQFSSRLFSDLHLQTINFGVASF